ncbi:NERD domain-containing protein [Microbacterium sp. LWH7-1.2]|uniref:nuclease-related domain-containing protein n=1 Tax=Microbacterium sp. LWH7-1.2 TaxID=3135257 RepID=UPI0031395EDF
MTTTDPTEQFGSIPAAAVIAACLQAQASVPPRSGVSRVFGRSPLSDDSRPWYLGALGELQVAARLAKLGPGWKVLHSVPIGERGSDIDHVVVGAAGVFTINTKFHEDARIWVGSKRLLVNGQKTDHLRNSRFEAQRVARALTAPAGLPVDVQPVIVLVGIRNITVRERPVDVAVVRDTELLRWLHRRPTTLDADLRDRLTAAMAQRIHWAAPPAQASEPDLPAFAALRREVDTARRTRVLWAMTVLAGFVTVAATLAVSTYSSLLGG